MIRVRAGTGAAGAVLIIAVLTACAAGRTLDGLYVDEAKKFRVRLPPSGWQVIDVRETDLALRDTRSRARMAVTATCPARESGPLEALVRHLYFGLKDVKRLRQERIVLNGVEGLDAMVTGTWEGAPVQVRSVVLRRAGCLYDLLFVAPPETFEARSADFDALLEGWQFLPGVP